MGTKDLANKLYYELDWTFVEAMARRMDKNKLPEGKYERYNWKKPINMDDLVQALTRHFIEIQKGNFEDEGEAFGHLTALAINAMMITYQLKNNESTNLTN